MRSRSSHHCAAVCAAFFLFFAVMSFSGMLWADPLFSDEAVTVDWPADVPHVPCEAELASRAGVACARLGADGNQGAVFVTKNAGYSLGNEALLSAHLRQSEEALADIPRIHVMQTRVFRTSPLVGLMEVLRKDGTLEAVEGLRGREIRQSSFLIPASDCLYQVFIYLPVDGDDRLYVHLLEDMAIQVTVAPKVEEKPQVSEGHGALELLPMASGIGLAVALTVILCLWHISRRRRADKDAAFDLEVAKASRESGDFDLSIELTGSEQANAEVCDSDTSDADSDQKGPA